MVYPPQGYPRSSGFVSVKDYVEYEVIHSYVANSSSSIVYIPHRLPKEVMLIDYVKINGQNVDYQYNMYDNNYRYGLVSTLNVSPGYSINDTIEIKYRYRVLKHNPLYGVSTVYYDGTEYGTCSESMEPNSCNAIIWDYPTSDKYDIVLWRKYRSSTRGKTFKPYKRLPSTNKIATIEDLGLKNRSRAHKSIIKIGVLDKETWSFSIPIYSVKIIRYHKQLALVLV